MNRHVYKSFFVFIAFLSLLAPASGFAFVRQATLISSDASDCVFELSFSPNLTDLTLISTPDSQAVFQQTRFVAIPTGASARLVLAEGKDLSPLDATVRARVSASMGARPLVELGSAVTVRGRRLVPVMVAPVVGGSVYQTVEISLSFAGGLVNGPAAPADPFFDRVIGPYVVNAAAMQNWPVRSGPAAGMAIDGPFSFATDWYKVEVAQTGLHRITGADLQAAGISLANLASSDVRCFNGGGQPIPGLATAAQPFFQEIALRIDDGGDGLIGASDRIYFYGESVDRWTVNETGGQLYVNNIYTDRNVYWLSTGGSFPGGAARMASVSAAPVNTPDTIVSTYRRRIRSEQDKLLLKETGGHIDSYYRWYWSDQTNLEFSVPTMGYIPGDTASAVAFTYTGGSYTSLRVNGASVPRDIGCNTFNCEFLSTALTGGIDLFSFTMQRNTLADVPYFDYMELSYTSQMLPASDKLNLILPSINALAELSVVDNFSADPWVLDLADPLHPVVLTGAVRGGGTLRFQTPLENPGRNQFLLSTTSVAYAPVAIRGATVTDLYSQTEQTDLIVVTPRAFSDDLDEYVAYRSAEGTSIKIVAVEDIMDNFAFGLTDPGAIRNYLKYAYAEFEAPAPYGVLLVGDANYDYLDRLATGQPNYVPSYIHSLSVDNTYSDDNYVYFGDYGILDSDTTWDTSAVNYDRGYDMMVARWPVKSVAEINAIVDKIRRYDAESTFGPWRNRLTFVADDEFNPDRPGFLEPFHVVQSETLSVWHTPNHFDRQKVYLWDFALANNTRPDGNNAIVSAVNGGTLLINYVGHGNPDVWAHERVFTRGADLPRLSNRNQLPLFFAASCAIGFFDDPKREGMAEDLLSMSGGGAIGVVSATRLVYSFDNALFNQQVFDVLLDNNDLTMCEAVFVGKLLKQYGTRTYPVPRNNDRAYAFFGDPLLKLAAPRYRIEFFESPDSLAALARSSVRGRVVDRSGQPVNASGTATISVYDSDRERNHLLNNGSDTVRYAVTGASMFRGSAGISNGEFAFEFVTPLDIGIGGQGARISVYGVIDSVDAIGLIDSLPVSSVVAPTTDSVGPMIAVAVSGRGELVNGDLVTKKEELVVTVADSSGVNLATGLGHGITLEVDDETQSIRNLTELFRYQQDDFTTGSLTLALDEFEPGLHTLKFKAWDNANNASTFSISMEVATGASLAIQDLLNYPNPMADSTTFFFELTQAVSQFDLDIFTLSGRKIRSIRRLGVPVGSHQIAWNGRDADGDRVATGVYIFKASAHGASGGEPVESFGKIVVVN